uniref:Uncharacterized protein n=1 Tax=Sander lucioperca TaxID=283035 RepID=A0A8D0CQ80_SANLU
MKDKSLSGEWTSELFSSALTRLLELVSDASFVPLCLEGSVSKLSALGLLTLDCRRSRDLINTKTFGLLLYVNLHWANITIIASSETEMASLVDYVRQHNF